MYELQCIWPTLLGLEYNGRDFVTADHGVACPREAVFISDSVMLL